MAAERSNWTSVISAEVQRTLVKSPPELWTELSDPKSLARHLGEFGEIRITRVQPEESVEWEAENASGSVLIKPSGWGTRVTLSVSGELAVPDEPDAPEQDARPAAQADAQPRDGAGEAHPASDGSQRREDPGGSGLAAAGSGLAAWAHAHEPKPAPEEGAAKIDGPPAIAEQQAVDEPPAMQEPPALEEPPAIAEPPSVREPAVDREPADAWEQTPFEDAAIAGAEAEASGTSHALPRRGFLAWVFRRRRGAAARDASASGWAADPDEQADDRGEAPLSHGADALYEADDAYDPVDDYETYAPEAPEAAGAPLQAQTAAAQELSAAARAEEESAGDDVARAAEPAQSAGDADAERLRSALASVLDRLGSAHHRPFSRP